MSSLSSSSRPEFKRAAGSVASMGSNLAAHAKTLVGSFACNEKNAGQFVSSERATEEWRDRRNAKNGNEQQTTQGLEMSRSGSTNRSYRDTRRVDV